MQNVVEFFYFLVSETILLLTQSKILFGFLPFTLEHWFIHFVVTYYSKTFFVRTMANQGIHPTAVHLTSISIPSHLFIQIIDSKHSEYVIQLCNTAFNILTVRKCSQAYFFHYTVVPSNLYLTSSLIIMWWGALLKLRYIICLLLSHCYCNEITSRKIS